jgi:hypothetical protein
MSDKKNIDRLFQEKFKDFEVTPPDFVWENIQEALQEKRQRRVIPLWLRLSGVAAVLAIGSIFVSPSFNGRGKNDNPVVIDNNGSKQGSPLASPTGDAAGNPAIVTESGATGQGTANTAVATSDDQPGTGSKTAGDGGAATKTPVKTSKAHPAFSTDNAVAHDNSSAAVNKNNGKRVRSNKAIRQSDGIAHNDSSNRREKNNGAGSGSNNPAQQDSPGAIASTSQTSAAQLAQDGLQNGQQQAQDSNNRSNEGIAGTDANTPRSNNPANNAQNQNRSTVTIDKTIPVTDGAVAQAAIDTTTVAAPENELEKLLREKLNGKDQEKEKAIAEAAKGKWNLKPQMAPIFYNSLSDGSPIDQQFAGNSKSYDNDLSVGLGVNYAVNDRISIRSGINTVNLSYATNDIEFHASLNQTTGNISTSANATNIVVEHPNAQPDPSSFVIDQSSTTTSTGAMVQKTGYIEVPLEMSYAVVNNKFGIDVIGGVSTLFLNKNNVSVVSSQGYSSNVGEAQNLNNVHFSTNVGLGFKYKFWDSFQASFEPMFKYQVNTFSRDAGNFKPYFIGLYTGVSFRF